MRRNSIGYEKPRMNQAAKTAEKVSKIKNAAMIREAKHQANLKRGGIRGAWARAVDKARAKHEALVAMEKAKPDLYKRGQKAQIQAASHEKVIKAKGAAAGVVATALGTSYARAKAYDAAVAEAKARSDEANSKALTDLLTTIPDVDGIYNNQNSGIGLKEGTR